MCIYHLAFCEVLAIGLFLIVSHTNFTSLLVSLFFVVIIHVLSPPPTAHMSLLYLLPPMQSGVCCTLCWSSLLWCSSSLLLSGVPAAATSEGEPNWRALLGGGAQEPHLTHDTDKSMQAVYCKMQASGPSNCTTYIRIVLMRMPSLYVCMYVRTWSICMPHVQTWHVRSQVVHLVHSVM